MPCRQSDEENHFARWRRWAGRLRSDIHRHVRAETVMASCEVVLLVIYFYDRLK